MGDKNHNRLPINLPQLQNLIKRDKDAYAEEFNQQYRHYQALLQIFHLKPTAEAKELDDIVMFLAQVVLTRTENVYRCLSFEKYEGGAISV